MFRPVRVSAPTELPISVAHVKASINIDHSDDDALVDVLIRAAVVYLDGYSGTLGRCIVNQVWRQNFACWAWRMRLPFPDISSVSITYQDADNATQIVPAADFEVAEDAIGPVILFKTNFNSPSLYNDMAAPITVEFTAGYGTAADVPENLTIAIQLLVGHWYENREATGDAERLPFGLDMLIAPLRRNLL